jgi:hypothetical protein
MSVRPDRAPQTQPAGKQRDAGAHRRSEKRALAHEICVLYHEAVRAEVAALTKGGRRHKPSRGLEDVDRSTRRAFLAAAVIALEEDADARDFVAAQFAMWRSASAFHKKFMIPSPQQMGTEGARVRYLQHKVNAEVRRSRVVTVDEQDAPQRFYVEERQLRGLARVQRSDPADVIADQPERFSREFLKHKGAWGAVKDVWEERTRA